MDVINDEALLETIIEDIINNYDKTEMEAEAIAKDIAPYLVECMWSEFDQRLAEEVSNSI